VYSESIFSGDIVHTKEVVHSLPWKKCAEPLWCQAPIIKPVNIPWRIVSFTFVWPQCQEIAGCRQGRSISLSGASPCVLLIPDLQLPFLPGNHRGITGEQSLPIEKVLSHPPENVISTFYRFMWYFCYL
jgi:hypothetical protein